MTAKRQHLVSQGYLRGWSDDGRRVLLCDKPQLKAKRVSLRDVFVVKNLLTVREGGTASDAAEVELSRVEAQAIPAARSFAEGNRGNDEAHGVKRLVALHFARSYAVRAASDRIRGEVRTQLAAELDGDDDFRSRFVAESGRLPEIGEVRLLVEHAASDLDWANSSYVEAVFRMYHRALEEFRPLHIQTATVRRPQRGELIVADSPVVVTRDGSGTATSPVPLLQADLLWFPLTSTVGVSLTTDKQGDVILDESGVHAVNRLSWDYASRRVIARLDSRINRALGYSTENPILLQN